MTTFSESLIEQAAIDWFTGLSYAMLPKLMSGQVRVTPTVIASAQGHEAIPIVLFEKD